MRYVRLPDAIHGGLRFLLSRQDADGAWRDFPMPPGLSCCWTTAYVLQRVRQAAAIVPCDARSALDGGVAHLRCHARPDGWGFNLDCAPDADSTAHALLALPCVEAKHAAALARFFLPENGARTYLWPPSGHIWSGPHPDVTATALRALRAWVRDDHTLMRGGLSWLSTQDAAFWWTTPRYLDLEKLRLGMTTTRSAAGATSAFEAALALECAILTGAEAPFEALLSRQLSDGSWDSAPVLRLPNRNDAKTLVYADQHRLFTTATVLSALARLRM